MIVGFFFVRPVPLPEEEINREVHLEASSSAYEQRNSSHTPLLYHDPHINGQDDDDDARIGVELSPTSRSQISETSRSIGRIGRIAVMALEMPPNVYGKKLWCSGDFWLLFSILSIRTFACLSTIFIHL